MLNITTGASQKNNNRTADLILGTEGSGWGREKTF